MMAITTLFSFSELQQIDWRPVVFLRDAWPLLFSTIAIVVMKQTKQGKRKHNAMNVILKAILMTVVIFIVTLSAIIFPKSKILQTTGEYQVMTTTFTYTDKSRIESYTDTGEHRKLNVTLWYPEISNEKFPLVVFSHGGLGTKSSNESLYKELASHGYVVASIDHTYQCFYTTYENGQTVLIDMGYMRELQAEDAKSNKEQSLAFYQKWMNVRMGDINFVIDFILSETKKVGTDAVYNRIDTSKIGVMGHSLGGAAALGIGRTRKDVRAVIALESPFMHDIVNVEDGEFVFVKSDYPLPVLNVYSDSGWNILADRPQYARNYAMLNDSVIDTHHVYISGVGHLSLTDLPLLSPILVRILDGQKSTKDIFTVLKTINKISLDFFDMYLKGKGVFESSLVY